jgi:hypothetical protein
VQKLKDYFLLVDWKTDVMGRFYWCTQGKCDLCAFAAEFVQFAGALPLGTISTSTLK